MKSWHIQGVGVKRTVRQAERRDLVRRLGSDVGKQGKARPGEACGRFKGTRENGGSE